MGIELLADLLPEWYSRSSRDLPWRKDRDPYHVWVSEVMLQQTRVEAVKFYYQRFLDALPTVYDLAKCPDDVLNKLWEGLGYYSRVRNMKKAAQIVTEQYNGVFPCTHPEVLALPGIGAYIAGAICSICFGLKTPAVDGNVLRVVTRYAADFQDITKPQTKQKIQTALEAVYPEDAGTFTQALMELGATVCVPNGIPRCEVCPLKDSCLSVSDMLWQQIPVKTPKSAKKQVQMTFFVLQSDDRIAVRKRPPKGLLADLWELPNVESALLPENAVAWLEACGCEVKEIIGTKCGKHIFTHIRWDIQCYYVTCSQTCDAWRWVSVEELESDVALPTAFRQFLVNNAERSKDK